MIPVMLMDKTSFRITAERWEGEEQSLKGLKLRIKSEVKLIQDALVEQTECWKVTENKANKKTESISENDYELLWMNTF